MIPRADELSEANKKAEEQKSEELKKHEERRLAALDADRFALYTIKILGKQDQLVSSSALITSDEDRPRRIKPGDILTATNKKDPKQIINMIVTKDGSVQVTDPSWRPFSASMETRMSAMVTALKHSGYHTLNYSLDIKDDYPTSKMCREKIREFIKLAKSENMAIGTIPPDAMARAVLSMSPANAAAFAAEVQSAITASKSNAERSKLISAIGDAAVDHNPATSPRYRLLDKQIKMVGGDDAEKLLNFKSDVLLAGQISESDLYEKALNLQADGTAVVPVVKTQQAIDAMDTTADAGAEQRVQQQIRDVARQALITQHREIKTPAEIKALETNPAAQREAQDARNMALGKLVEEKLGAMGDEKVLETLTEALEDLEADGRRNDELLKTLEREISEIETILSQELSVDNEEQKLMHRDDAKQQFTDLKAKFDSLKDKREVLMAKLVENGAEIKSKSKGLLAEVTKVKDKYTAIVGGGGGEDVKAPAREKLKDVEKVSNRLKKVDDNSPDKKKIDKIADRSENASAKFSQAITAADNFGKTAPTPSR